MRVLNIENATIIMNNIRKVFSDSPFMFKNKWARIISGEEEGAYGWITVNYLLNTLDSTDSNDTTFGALDLGGKST